MIRLTELTLSRGGRTLLDRITVTLPPRTRTAIVGANGVGKSTLFAGIRGELVPDRGSAELPGGWVIAHVDQEIASASESARDFVLRGDAELIQLETEIALLLNETHADAGVQLAERHAQYDAIDGHRARARAAELLAGLGFTNDDQARAVDSFSGGWRMRLALARALMTRSDLLLLDEPTNHLDVDAVLWLEDWLLRYRGTLLMITHDREFLDAIAQYVLHLDGNNSATLYTGNYSAFESQREQRQATQRAAFEKQAREIKHLEAFVERFRAKATKAKQAQSRLKTLEKIERIAAVRTTSSFSFAFREPIAISRQLVHLEAAALGYADKTILTHVNLTVWNTSRIGLLGRNGEGKSTLLKSMAGVLPLLAGARSTGQHLKVGYFDQHQVESLRLSENAMWHMLRAELAEAEASSRSPMREQDLRNFLGSFAFVGERINEPVQNFSGGEKARLALALIVWQRPNLLILDEPTNHLDIEMREALIEALLDFSGAMVIVAHDRHLLRATCDEFVWVRNGEVVPFDGDLDDYRDALTKKVAAPTDEATARVTRKDERRSEAQAREQLAVARKPLLKKVNQIEAALDKLTQEHEQLTQWLASDAAYGELNKQALADATRRVGELATEIAWTENEWLTLHTQLEGIA